MSKKSTPDKYDPDLLYVARGAWRALLISRHPATRQEATDVFFETCEFMLDDWRKAHGFTVAVIRDRNAK